MLVRLCPPSVVKKPPTRIFPSACTARQYTVPPAPGLKLVSSAPSALSPPMPMRLCPPRVLKPPPTRIFPSACTAREYTELSSPGLNESGSGDCARTARAKVWAESASATQRPAWRIRLCVLILLDWTARWAWLNVEEWVQASLQARKHANEKTGWTHRELNRRIGKKQGEIAANQRLRVDNHIERKAGRRSKSAQSQA